MINKGRSCRVPGCAFQTEDQIVGHLTAHTPSSSRSATSRSWQSCGRGMETLLPSFSSATIIHATALHILRDAGEAEDTTQTIFLEVYRKPGQFDPARGTLKVWLLQFAYSRSINRRNYLTVRQHQNQADLALAEEEEQGLWSRDTAARSSARAYNSAAVVQSSRWPYFLPDGKHFRICILRRGRVRSATRSTMHRLMERWIRSC